MRKYLNIYLDTKKIDEKTMQGEELAWAGRYFIAKTLVDEGLANIDPFSPENPLIFSAGPFSGTNWSNANRTSVGCKSPLTGGVKEANGGGSFSLALGQQEIAGFTLRNASDDWVVIHFSKDGEITFDDATPFMGKDNFECAEMLHEKYGKKVSLGICGPVGEYGGLLSGIAFSDTEKRPSRLAARGGVGAVMGNKKVKAIVVDLHKLPGFHDRKKVITAVRDYGDKIRKDEMVKVMRERGTAMMADYTNHVGGLPVNNFSKGRQVDTSEETFKMGGQFINDRNKERGGVVEHACMPGCQIECSNIYADENGKEITSPVEYETLGLLGTNLGITEPDDLARLNHMANQLGVDTIETGATLGVLMEAGLAEFGDMSFLINAMKEIQEGTDDGKLWAQGTARVGEHYKVSRLPVIKKQGISAYDPRVIEVTGLSMMISAQGADHTVGNVPTYKCADKDLAHLVNQSMMSQVTFAASDSLGLCIFGRTVTNTSVDFIIKALNDALGTDLDESFFEKLGRDTLKYEDEFNLAAGFTVEDDELPQFFYDEALEPSNKTARFHCAELREEVRKWWEKDAEENPSLFG
jgi:aldehyde:ferredoxin oxidoreductase